MTIYIITTKNENLNVGARHAVPWAAIECRHYGIFGGINHDDYHHHHEE